MNNKNGFTLVEILVVIAIVAILSILILPNFISSFNTTSKKAMAIQENQIVDASKLFIEDFCRHPLNMYKGECSTYSVQTSNTNVKYTCLNTLQTFKYLDPITAQEETCYGFVVYNSDYSNYKSYIQCGNSYQTEGIASIKNSSNEYVLEKCGGTINPNDIPDTPNPPNPPGPVITENYQNTATNTRYETLKEAFNAIENNQTIKVLQDTTENLQPTLAATKIGIKLDLNGKTLTINNYDMVINGQLDIYNSSSTPGTINGGIDQLIYNKGSLTLNNTSTANKIIIDKTSNYNNNATISASKESTTIINDNVEIKVSNNNSNGFANRGIATINGGTIISENASTSVAVSNIGTLTINGGTFKGKDCGVTNNTYLEDYGNTTINGGFIYGGTCGVLVINNSTLTLGTNDSTVNTTSPVIQSNCSDYYCHAISNEGGTFNYYDGLIKSPVGTQKPILNEVSTLPNGYTVHTETVSNSLNIYLISNYYNTTTKVSYKTLKEALAAAENNQTIKVLSNTTETEQASVASGKTGIKLDLNGKTITTTNYIGNSGELDIYNSSSTPGIIEGSYDTCVLANPGTLTLNKTSSTNKVIIRSTNNSNNNKAIFTNRDNSKLTIYSNVEVIGAKYGISVYGEFTNNGGTITSPNETIFYFQNSKITLNSGKISGKYGMYTYQGDTIITINGGTLEGTTDAVVTHGQLIIKGGVFNGDVNVNSNATATISGTPTINGELKVFATAVMTGGTINNDDIWAVTVTAGATFTLGTNDSNVSVTSPSITCTNTTSNYGAVTVAEGGIFNFYDGIIKSSRGTGYAIKGNVNSIPASYSIYKETTNGIESAYLKK